MSWTAAGPYQPLTSYLDAKRKQPGSSEPDFQCKRTERQTNVADKHKLVLEQTKREDQVHIDDQACLVSLPNKELATTRFEDRYVQACTQWEVACVLDRN